MKPIQVKQTYMIHVNIKHKTFSIHTIIEYYCQCEPHVRASKDRFIKVQTLDKIFLSGLSNILIFSVGSS